MKNERLNSFSTDEPRESSAHSAEISNAMPASEHSLGYGTPNWDGAGAFHLAAERRIGFIIQMDFLLAMAQQLILDSHNHLKLVYECG